jgi:hypothetical protein
VARWGEETEDAVARALAFVADQQQPSGEFPSVAAFLDQGDPVWEPDTLTFITALVLLALARLPAERTDAGLTESAMRFLVAQREPGDRWRYWETAHERHAFTPPDADDTACASMAMNGGGVDTSANVRLLLANRDERGRFYTWLIPHRPWPRHPLVWWHLRGELRARERRQELWESTEAEHGDVDGIVNANVVRYLGTKAPEAAVEYVAQLIEDDREADCDSWHHSPYVLYASVADGHRRGVGRFAELAPLIEDKIARATRSDGTVGTPFDAAHALAALVAYERRDHLEALLDGLVTSQRADGSWERSVCYFGGPQEVFGWASDALTAAVAAAAMSQASALLR